MRLIDGDALFGKAAELEVSALQMVAKTARDEDTTEWKKWSFILMERTAFRYDVADAPTIDAVPVVMCERCRYSEGKPIADGRLWCRCLNAYMRYCSEGERREETANV